MESDYGRALANIKDDIPLPLEGTLTEIFPRIAAERDDQQDRALHSAKISNGESPEGFGAGHTF